MTKRCAAASVAVLLLLVGGVACRTGSSSSTSTTVGSTLPPFDPAQRLPPNDVGALRRLYDPVLATMGLRMTRAQLVDATDGRYQPSNDGTHLALYVEPTGDYTTDEYATGFWQLTSLMTPDVFNRWPELVSYDICTEPLPSVDDRPEPFPVTQVNLSRVAASQIDWEDGSLVDLLAASRTLPDVKVVFNRDVRASESYRAADDAAKARVVGATTSTLG
jgi:hypothetical protein